jgi:hypothetical protein
MQNRRPHILLRSKQWQALHTFYEDNVERWQDSKSMWKSRINTLPVIKTGGSVYVYKVFLFI